MLKARVITAILLLALVVPCLFYASPTVWALFSTFFVSLGVWEWGRLSGLPERGSRFAGGLGLVVLLLFFYLFPDYVLFDISKITPESISFAFLFPYAIAGLFWLCIVPVWLKKHWKLAGSPFVWPVGLVVLIPTWLAIIQLRFFSAPVLISLLAVVWVADISAYFCGKRFGKNKLAIKISPGKTWEGAIGAAFLVSIYGFVVARFFWNIPLSFPVIVCAMLFFTAVSIVGDLFESLLKRQIGLKDSSNILPGHGGVLDRIDSLTSVLPLMVFTWLLFVKVN